MTQEIRRAAPYKLIKYINEGKDTFEEEKHFLILQNSQGFTPNGVAKDFFENNEHIPRGKAKRVGLTHVILSWSNKDTLLLDDTKLHACARQFCHLVDPKQEAIIFGRPHFGNTTHLHFAISGSKLSSNKSMRLSKAKLKELQIDMERFQQEQFPELKRSLNYLPEAQKSAEYSPDISVPLQFKPADASIQVKKRGEPSLLDNLRQQLADVAKDNPTKESFLKALERHSQFKVYYYRNRPNGIVFGSKKYRFKRLGIDLKALRNFTRSLELEQLHEQSKVKSSHTKSRSK